jgi:hypothetical protein
MENIKNAYAYIFGKKEVITGTEDVAHIEQMTKTRKKRTKTFARKSKERRNKKKKKRQLKNEKRLQYNIENNIQFGYECPPEYIIDDFTNEDIYYSTKHQAAETYKNKIIRKTNMTTREFYKELEDKDKDKRIKEEEKEKEEEDKDKNKDKDKLIKEETASDFEIDSDLESNSESSQ